MSLMDHFHQEHMTEHNRHHNEELHDIAHSLGGETEELIHTACDYFSDGIEKLEAALTVLERKGE